MSIPYAEVIGDPIGHSKSPLIHNHWLARQDIRGEYKATLVAGSGLANFLEQRRTDPSWRGCNVTMPHKQAILPLLDSVSEEAMRIGAVNTVARDAQGRLHGRNTDIDGVLRCLDKVELKGRKALLVGAGGAARAAAFALHRMGAEVHVMNRSVDKARQLLMDFELGGEALPLGKFPPADLVLNASALGMLAHPWKSLDLDELPPEAIVMDMVYAPRDTALLGEAARLGLKTIDGIDMLVEQASEAFSLFFSAGVSPAADDDLRRLLDT